MVVEGVAITRLNIRLDFLRDVVLPFHLGKLRCHAGRWLKLTIFLLLDGFHLTRQESSLTYHLTKTGGRYEFRRVLTRKEVRTTVGGINVTK